MGEDTSRTESDVYSYGMVVWHIFSRQLPWEGKRMTDPQIMRLTVMNKKVGFLQVWFKYTCVYCILNQAYFT